MTSAWKTIVLPTTTNAHSIAVSPLNGDVFVPLGGTTAGGVNTACALRCIFDALKNERKERIRNVGYGDENFAGAKHSKILRG